MTKFFKIKEEPYLWLLLCKGNFSYKLWLSTTAVVLQHLIVNDTEDIDHQTQFAPPLPAGGLNPLPKFQKEGGGGEELTGSQT